MTGILSVVGTPIGNLEDASPRVRRTLGEADVILCEDTRVTARLLSAFDLHVPLVRCDENVIASRVASALERIEAGESVFPHIFGYSNEQARVWGRRGDWRKGREEGSVCRGV